MLDSLGIKAVNNIKTYHQPISQEEYYSLIKGCKDGDLSAKEALRMAINDRYVDYFKYVSYRDSNESYYIRY